MSLNYFDNVTQSWGFRLPRDEKFHFRHAIKPQNIHN